jgi:hypothetical protein
MARKHANSSNSATLDLTDDLRRQDQRPDRPDSLPETRDDLARSGIAPSEDGDNEQHPIHDEDLEDLEPEDYEDMVDELEDQIGDENGEEDEEE